MLLRLLALTTVALMLGACGGNSRGGSDQVRADQRAADQTMRDAISAVAQALGGTVNAGRGSWITCDMGQGVQYSAWAQVQFDKLSTSSRARASRALEDAGFRTGPTEDDEGVEALRDGSTVIVGVTQAPDAPAMARLTLDSSCRHYDSEVEDHIHDQPVTTFSPSE